MGGADMRHVMGADISPMAAVRSEPAHRLIARMFRFAFSFLVDNYREILRRIILPAALGWIVLYGSFAFYLTELRSFLETPNDRTASLVLGVASGGLLATIFVHAVIAASLTSLALGRQESGFKYFNVTRRVWRLYAAALRLLAVCTVFVVAIESGRRFVGDLVPSPWAASAANVIIVVGLGFLLVRIGFLMSTVAVAESRGTILRRAWRISASNSWRLAAAVLILVLLVFAIEIAGEMLLRAMGMFPSFGGQTPLSEAVALYQTVLPYVLGAVGIAYVIGVVLLCAASTMVYRERTARQV